MKLVLYSIMHNIMCRVVFGLSVCVSVSTISYVNCENVSHYSGGRVGLVMHCIAMLLCLHSDTYYIMFINDVN